MGFTYIGPRLASQIKYILDENIGEHIDTVTRIDARNFELS